LDFAENYTAMGMKLFGFLNDDVSDICVVIHIDTNLPQLIT